MKLADYRDTYYTASSATSDITRQLSFAGIALVWIFKADKGGPVAIPQSLLIPASLFVATLALDLLQNVYRSLVWGAYSRYLEWKRTPEDAEVDSPDWFNWPALFLFWAKLATLILAYCFTFTFVAALIHWS